MGTKSYGGVKMDEYSFCYPKNCTRCENLSSIHIGPTVQPYYQEGDQQRIMLVGQDPTIYKNQEKINTVLDLDKENGQLRRWLTDLLGSENFSRLSIYATNLVKCFFDKPPTMMPEGGFNFLKLYFEQCKDYLVKEIIKFKPALVLTFGEPAHKLFITMLDNRSSFGEGMQEAFIGKFKKAELQGFKFDYSPCLHIKTFRVADTYGDSIKKFKDGLADYLK
jgi:uracil-DNA glycosylase